MRTNEEANTNYFPAQCSVMQFVAFSFSQLFYTSRHQLMQGVLETFFHFGIKVVYHFSM